jgi:hypothetical protein
MTPSSSSDGGGVGSGADTRWSLSGVPVCLFVGKQQDVDGYAKES